MREYIVFVGKEHYNPLGIIRTLGEAGINPVVIIVSGDLKFVGQSKYVKKKHYVKTPEEGVQLLLNQYKDNSKSFILAGDDITVATLDRHYDDLKQHFYFYNAGSRGRVIHYMDKENMKDIAIKHGLNVAKTWRVKNGEIPSDIHYPVMTKAVNSFGSEWKNIVFICKCENDLKEAYGKIKSNEIMLQQYVNKVDEISFDGFSINQGNQVAILTEAHQEYCLIDKYSPYWIIKNNEHKDISEKIEKIIKEIGFEGIFEFEFLLDENGVLWFLEINFRNTALGYSTTSVNMPQIVLWCESIENGIIPADIIKRIPDNHRAIAECFDYDVRVKNNWITKKEWLRQYRECNCKLYKGHDDIIPFIRFMVYKLTKMKKHNNHTMKIGSSK